MLEKLAIKWLQSKIDSESARNCPVGGVVNVKGVAHGIKLLGMTWELGLVFKRTK